LPPGSDCKGRSLVSLLLLFMSRIIRLSGKRTYGHYYVKSGGQIKCSEAYDRQSEHHEWLFVDQSLYNDRFLAVNARLPADISYDAGALALPGLANGAACLINWK
jgi:hypothetical protein